MGFGSLKNNSNKPLEFNCPKNPIKFLETHLSYDQSENNKKIFFFKIKKMETKLNLWLSRDLTLFGRTLLVKSLSLSQLIYSSSMLSVPEPVIQQTQTKLFSFLWKHKKDKIKRQVQFSSNLCLKGHRGNTFCDVRVTGQRSLPQAVFVRSSFDWMKTRCESVLLSWN